MTEPSFSTAKGKRKGGVPEGDELRRCIAILEMQNRGGTDKLLCPASQEKKKKKKGRADRIQGVEATAVRGRPNCFQKKKGGKGEEEGQFGICS